MGWWTHRRAFPWPSIGIIANASQMGMSLSRIAIIGSCITRDLWPILGEETRDLLYVSRTSLASLFAPAMTGVAIASEPPEPLKRHQHSAMAADLRKSALGALVAHEPTHIIFDFIDERFDLLAVESSIATHSWELDASGYLDQPAFQGARTIPRLGGACQRLWSDGLSMLIALLATTTLGRAKLILHVSQWANQYLSDDGLIRDFAGEVEILPGRPGSGTSHNLLLTRYQSALTTALPDIAVVSAPANLRIARETHRWGLSPFHYIDDYYVEIWRQLAALGV